MIPKTMMAAVLGAPGELDILELAVPVPGPEDVLVKVRRASLCGTDIKIRSHAFFATGAPPSARFVPGHEYAGVVVGVGSTVDEFAVGDRVVTEAHRGCMRCNNCLRGHYTDCLNYGRREKGHRTQGMTVNGGFAEFVVNPVSTLTRLPDSVSFDDGVILTTVGTVMHAFDVLHSLIVGSRLVVIGPGPIGLLAVQVANELGADKVVLVGTRESRLALGAKYGAVATVNSHEGNVIEQVRNIIGEHGADIVLECSGATATVDQALHMTKRGGSIVLVGFFPGPVTADLNRAVLNGITMHSVRGEGSGSAARAVSLAARGRLTLDTLVTHHFALEEISTAFDTYAERRGDAIKVMLDISEEPSTPTADSHGAQLDDLD